MDSQRTDRVFEALDLFRIEVPSWGFANTGTRFGKFLQPAAAATIEEKFSDAGQVHGLTGVCPTVALHVLWDLPDGRRRAPTRSRGSAERYRHPAGLDQSEPLPGPELQVRIVRQSRSRPCARRRSHAHASTASQIARRLRSRDISLWFADGSNYPGTANIRQRKQWFEEGLQALHARARRRSAPAGRVQAVRAGLLPHRHRRLGHGAAARARRRAAGQGAGRHRATTTRRRTSSRSSRGCSSEDMLGGFHFNDRRYADDDLTLGLDRSVPGLPHLPRDPRSSSGKRARAPTSPT